MKKIIISIIVISWLLTVPIISVSAFDIVHDEAQVIPSESVIPPNGELTLVASSDIFDHGYVYILDFLGNIVWSYVTNGWNMIHDVDRLPNGNILIADGNAHNITEVNQYGEIVWLMTGEQLQFPFTADRLSNGNTLIAALYCNGFGDVVAEVNQNYEIVWKMTGFGEPTDAERLPNGDTLIADIEDGRVIEVNQDCEIVWQMTENEGLYRPGKAERLPNGNTLITDLLGYSPHGPNNRVIEVNQNCEIIWEYTRKIDLFTNMQWRPDSIKRLDNGNTLMADGVNSMVIEVDQNGEIVWQKSGVLNTYDAERFYVYTSPPNKPTITGLAIGNPRTSYEYTFVSADPDGDNISQYIVNWGDGNQETITGPFTSGAPVTKSHSWFLSGAYIIKVKATDIYGAGSDWATLPITMPLNLPDSQQSGPTPQSQPMIQPSSQPISKTAIQTITSSTILLGKTASK